MHKTSRLGFLIEHTWTFLVALSSVPQWNLTPVTAEVYKEAYTNRNISLKEKNPFTWLRACVNW